MNLHYIHSKEHSQYYNYFIKTNMILFITIIIYNNNNNYIHRNHRYNRYRYRYHTGHHRANRSWFFVFYFSSAVTTLLPSPRSFESFTTAGRRCFLTVLQTPVAPASAPGHFFCPLVALDAELPTADRTRVAVRVLTAAAVCPGHGPAAVLDGVPSETHQWRSAPSSQRRRFGGARRRGPGRASVRRRRRRFRPLCRTACRRRLLLLLTGTIGCYLHRRCSTGFRCRSPTAAAGRRFRILRREPVEREKKIYQHNEIEIDVYR